jgi:hypothetical protein
MAQLCFHGRSLWPPVPLAPFAPSAAPDSSRRRAGFRGVLLLSLSETSLFEFSRLLHRHLLSRHPFVASAPSRSRLGIALPFRSLIRLRRTARCCPSATSSRRPPPHLNGSRAARKIAGDALSPDPAPITPPLFRGGTRAGVLPPALFLALPESLRVRRTFGPPSAERRKSDASHAGDGGADEDIATRTTPVAERHAAPGQTTARREAGPALFVLDVPGAHVARGPLTSPNELALSLGCNVLLKLHLPVVIPSISLALLRHSCPALTIQNHHDWAIGERRSRRPIFLYPSYCAPTLFPDRKNRKNADFFCNAALEAVRALDFFRRFGLADAERPGDNGSRRWAWVGGSGGDGVPVLVSDRPEIPRWQAYEALDVLERYLKHRTTHSQPHAIDLVLAVRRIINFAAPPDETG